MEERTPNNTYVLTLCTPKSRSEVGTRAEPTCGCWGLVWLGGGGCGSGGGPFSRAFYAALSEFPTLQEAAEKLIGKDSSVFT